MLSTLRHEARPYAGPDEFVTSCAELVRGGIERDERTLVLAGSDRFDDVRDALGAVADAVSFVPSDEHARNPGRIATMLHTFGSAEPERRCLGVSDAVVRGRSRPALAEMLLAECLLNSMALQSMPMSVHCLYDLDDLDDDAVGGMRRCHPIVFGLDANSDFDEALATALHGSDLDPVPQSAAHMLVNSGDLAAARAFVRSSVSTRGLAPDRADDLVLAANELLSNSLRHGGGRADLRIWDADESVVCEVHDHGYLRDPMIGRLAPGPEATSGRGLWLVHHLCDLAQVRSSETSGTVVRLFVDR